MRCTTADDTGSVTAEFATVIPAIVLVLACCLSGIQVASQQLQLQDAAAGSARALARGDPTVAGEARVAVSRHGTLVCATLTERAASLPGTLFRMTLSARSCALDGGL
jgi:Flp pilus assembly protein TadG